MQLRFGFQKEGQIAEQAVFQVLFADGGEDLFEEVLDTGFMLLGRELTEVEANVVMANIRQEYGADK